MTPEIRVWAPIAGTAALLLAILIVLAIVVSQQANIDRALIVQEQADHSLVLQHQALLKRIAQDEANVCQAARDSGDQTIVKILCPKGTP